MNYHNRKNLTTLNKKSHNEKRVGLMLDYINSTERKICELELIANFLPSIYELNLIYNKVLKGKYHDIRIDTKDIKLKNAIKKAYELKNEEDYNSEMIFRKLKE